MKLNRYDVIAYDPSACHTLGDNADDPTFAVGVVLGYDKYGECYDVMIGCDYVTAVITTDVLNSRTVKVLGTL